MANIAIEQVDALPTDALIELRMRIDQELASRAMVNAAAESELPLVEPTAEDREFVRRIFDEDEPVFRALAK